MAVPWQSNTTIASNGFAPYRALRPIDHNTPAPTDTHGFGNGDLNVINELRIPQWFKQHIAKPHSHQVLNRFFAQIVINAINLIFAEMFGQGCVQGTRGFQILAKGFFNNDAAVTLRDIMIMQAFGQIPK